jgi:hypothetical protein
MVVDFEIANSPAFRAATVAWKAPWNEKRIRNEFAVVEKWLTARGAKPGRWFFIEKGANRFVAAIETRSAVKSAGRVSVRTFPRTAVVRVEFDPDEVSSRIVYHGLNDFLRYRRKDKTIRSVGDYREVYATDPWQNAKAWSSTRVEAVVRRT